MRLCHCQMALLVPDVSLQGYLIIQKNLFEQNKAFFIRDKYSHLAVCLHMIQLIFDETDSIKVSGGYDIVSLNIPQISAEC